MVENPGTRNNSCAEFGSVQSTILISQPNYMKKTGQPQVSVKTRTPKRHLKKEQTASSIFQSVPLIQNEFVGTLKVNQHASPDPVQAITDTTKMINYSSDANIQPMTYA